MIWVLRQILATYPQMQLIFNYAPGQEKENARRIFHALGDDPRILIDVKAKSARELYALASMVTLYFGNEGGARHIVHAAGRPSYVVCAPSSNKQVWLPQNDIPSQGIAISDICSPEERARMSYSEQYEAITPQRVWQELQQFISKI
jgi:heptosyltransferase-2